VVLIDLKMSRPNYNTYNRIGENAFGKMEKLSGELLSMTYGSLVTQLLKDLDHVQVVNEQLEKMGFNIGIRLVDEFLAKSGVGACQDFRETCEVIARVGLKMFLGIAGEVGGWNSEMTACSISLPENPLCHDFVELPPSLGDLCYSNLLCGVVRGALEELHMKVNVFFLKDTLKGDDSTEIRIELKQILAETFVDDEDN